MDYSEERRFVNNYIKKRRRERLLFELTSPEKRYDGASRFCHSSAELIDQSRVLMQGEDLDHRKEFKDFVKKHDELCFVLSPDFCLDGQHLPLKAAVAQAAMSTEAAVIIGSSFAVVFGEAEKGGRDKFLLTEKTGILVCED